MGLEAATTIASLDKTWPLGGDGINKGDDHLRLLKAMLKTQFPGAAGLGFAIPITAKETELNYLAGVTSNIQGQLNTNAAAIAALSAVLNAPTGTKLLFPQAAAPVGWTIDASNENTMLRVCDGSTTTGGATGGSDSPILNDKIPTHNHTASSNSTGNHTHEPADRTKSFVSNGATSAFFGATPGFSYGTHATTSSDGAHSHTITVNNNSGSNWAPKYLNSIVATKDA